MRWNTYFYCGFLHINNQPRFAKKRPPNITDHICKTQPYKKITFCCNAPLDQTFLFLTCRFWNLKAFMLNKKRNSKSGKTKIRKKDLKGKARQETKTRERIDKKLCNRIFLMLFFSWNKKPRRKKTKKETKTRNQKKAKKEKTRRKEGRKKRTRERERDRERKCAFLGERRFFLLKAKKEKDKKNGKNKKTKIPKMSFSVISQHFLVGVQNLLFLTTWPKSTPQNTIIKIGVSATRFLEDKFASRNRHFWTKNKPKTKRFRASFLGAFLFSFNNKGAQVLWNPIFIYSVLASLKKIIFKIWTENGKTPNLHPCWKRLFLENCQIIEHQKPQDDNWVCKKSLETTVYTYRGRKSPWTSL